VSQKKTRDCTLADNFAKCLSIVTARRRYA